MLTITTAGRKSGLPRTMPLLGVPIGDDIALVGTNFGRESTPAWVGNLRADPRAGINGPTESAELRSEAEFPALLTLEELSRALNASRERVRAARKGGQ